MTSTRAYTLHDPSGYYYIRFETTQLFQSETGSDDEVVVTRIDVPALGLDHAMQVVSCFNNGGQDGSR